MTATAINARRALAVMGAVGGGVLLLGASFAPRVQAGISCSYVGPPMHLLRITATHDAAGGITRRGEQIVVRERLERPTRCSGGVPTVFNTDRVTVSNRGEGDVELLLAGGEFAPGATAELVGVSEIEIEFRGLTALDTVVGTRHADQFHWAPGGAHAGLNLNPSGAGDQDVDVTIRGEFAGLAADGGAGNDTIVPAPGASFHNDNVFASGGQGNDRLAAPLNQSAGFDGGPGDDVLVGADRGDQLIGGRGDDRLVGGGGPDLIDLPYFVPDAASGRDFILSGPGRDRVNSRDSDRDRVRCGAGRDRVKADRRDRLRGCEIVRQRRPAR